MSWESCNDRKLSQILLWASIVHYVTSWLKQRSALYNGFASSTRTQNCAQLTGAVLNSRTQTTLFKPKMLGTTSLEVATSELAFVLNLSKGNSSCHLRALKLLQLLLLKTFDYFHSQLLHFWQLLKTLLRVWFHCTWLSCTTWLELTWDANTAGICIV